MRVTRQSYKLAGAMPVWVKTGEEKGFAPDDFLEFINRKTKLIIVNTPGNPTGAVFDECILKMIADIARDHDLFVLSDEVYEKIIYEGKHLSIASFDGMHERTVAVNGFSKAYAMTGWRLGYVAVTPGAAFGPHSNDYIRISYATSQARISEGLNRMREVLM